MTRNRTRPLATFAAGILLLAPEAAVAAGAKVPMPRPRPASAGETVSAKPATVRSIRAASALPMSLAPADVAALPYAPTATASIPDAVAPPQFDAPFASSKARQPRPTSPR